MRSLKFSFLTELFFVILVALIIMTFHLNPQQAKNVNSTTSKLNSPPINLPNLASAPEPDDDTEARGKGKAQAQEDIRNGRIVIYYGGIAVPNQKFKEVMRIFASRSKFRSDKQKSAREQGRTLKIGRKLSARTSALPVALRTAVNFSEQLKIAWLAKLSPPE